MMNSTPIRPLYARTKFLGGGGFDFGVDVDVLEKERREGLSRR